MVVVIRSDKTVRLRHDRNTEGVSECQMFPPATAISCIQYGRNIDLGERGMHSSVMLLQQQSQ
jgi:hypothetical protein